MIDRLQHAIWNNAHWCNLVCRVNGARGQFYDAAWICEAAAPQFYPNAISLIQGDAALEYIASLVTAGLGGQWGVKDSYASLPLGGLGFSQLFEAAWYWRAPVEPSPQSTTKWKVIKSAADLKRWENFWAGGAVGSRQRTFHTQLLRDENVRFLLGQSGSGEPAGLIASDSGPVVGISNVFGVQSVEFNEALDVIGSCFPRKPLVSYGSADGGSVLASGGFEELGPLRVWLKDERI